MGHDLYKTLGGFVEIATAWDTWDRAWSTTLNGGLVLRPVSETLADRRTCFV
ncbi:hypothetical protein [Hymenobacter defluvii]|uniref:Uncharacterized protein n=1 Tax=Hymenobacter defluvii TaxID=2054411 RepID=A0ABS3TFB9_9BACT|nr:hypothetical protein [Hymenobacter defluvii]